MASYVVLRDLHGDVFTYSDLGRHRCELRARGQHRGRRLPGRSPLRASAIAHGIGDSRCAAASLVEAGTVLGRVRVPIGARDGHLRFAIRPAGDHGTIDPGPILANWAQLAAALHPPGASGLVDPLDGAPAKLPGSDGTASRRAVQRRCSRIATLRPKDAGADRVRGEMSAGLWDELIARIGALPAPTVAAEPKLPGGWWVGRGERTPHAARPKPSLLRRVRGPVMKIISERS